MAKKVKKLRRKELLKDDEFLTSSRQFVNVLYENRKKIFIAVGGLFVIVILILAISAAVRSGEKKAENLFAMALVQYKEIIAKQQTAGSKSESDGGDPAKQFQEAAKKFEAVVEAYPRKRAGVLAMYYAANCYFKAKDYQASAQWYSDYLKKVGDDRQHAFVNLAYESLGYAQEMNGNLDEALQAFEKLDTPDNDTFRERGLFNAARIYQVKKNDTKALELYQALIKDYPDSLLAPQIKKVIAQLEMGF